MKARDWFVVGVRLLGVWFLGQAALFALAHFDFELGWNVHPNVANPSAYLLHAIGHLLIALLFLVGSSFLGRLFYGPESEVDHRKFIDEDHGGLSEPDDQITDDDSEEEKRPRGIKY